MSDESTREKIILAAGPIFAEKGYDSTTVRDICDSAKVNLASINYHFGDKQHLYLETVMQAREMRAQEFPEKQYDPDVPPEEKLRDIISILLNRLMALQAEPWQVRLLMREVLHPTEISQQLVDAHFRPFFNSLLLVVDELIGYRLPDSERNQIGLSITGQCVHYRLAPQMIAKIIAPNDIEKDYSIDQLVNHISTFSLGGIFRLRESLAIK